MHVITPEYHSYGLGGKSKLSPLGSLIQTGVCVPPTSPSSREKVTYTSILRIFFFISLFWAVLHLHCFAQAFSSCGKWELLSAVASLTTERGLWARRLQ